MTVQDMDISLNISTAPPAFTKKKQKVDDYLQSSVKRLGNETVGKGDQSQSKNVVVGQSGALKKRIKQQSLSTIVARQLKESGSVTRNQNVQKQSKLPSESKNKAFGGKSVDIPRLSKKQNSESSVSATNGNNGKSSDSILSFTKVTKDNVGKTILAKKRNTETDSKKSLSDIFSKPTESNRTETKLLKLIEDVESVEPHVPITIPKAEPYKKKFERNSKKSSFGNNLEGKQKKKFETNTDTAESDNKAFKPHHKSTGKISSLFGHNPKIPNIGQRLVKPVNEAVFAGASFSDLDIHPFMVSNLEQNMNITKMTMVQQKAIPQIFSGKDILIRSQTGSGKTLAYALPIVELLHKIRPKLTRTSGLNALIVVPTRELALQTYECFLKLIKPFTWIVPGYLVGGEKRKAEKARLRKGCNILIATPGRLLDHVKHTFALKLSDVKYFVLDEADRMLDMGYEKDISEIVTALKGTSTVTNDSGYNAMDILRKNVKKVFTETETALEEESEIVSETGSAKKRKEQEHSNESENSTNKLTQKRWEYHSGTDSDTEESNVPVKLKKLKTKQDVSKVNDKKDEGTLEKSETDSNVGPSKRQTILLSATLTHAIEKLAGLTMESPIFVDAAKDNLETIGGSMGDVNEDLIVPQSVTQSYIVTPPKLRMVTLAAYITGKCQSSGQHKILVFMATQDMIDYHTEVLSSVLTKPTDENDEDSDPLVDVEFFKLHGSMTQKERTDVFKTFRQAKSGVLLCTDVAARGLDMPKVDCVVQYTGPLSARDYVHRIGRTARAGSSGSAAIFLTPPEVEFARMLESRRIRIKQEDMNDVLDKLLGPLSKHASARSAAIALQNDFENLVVENKKLREKACKAYVSWVRFYASYPRDMREIFNRKELHLGHYAKSFALRDPPQRIGGLGKTLRDKDNSKPRHDNRLSNERPAKDGGEHQQQQQQQRQAGKKRAYQDGDRGRAGMLKRVRMLNTSEYGSGLEPARKPKKSG